MVVVDYFAEAYLGLLSGEHIVALKLLYWVLKYLSQGHNRMFPVRAPTSNSYVMKPLDGHHNTYLHCFVVVFIFFGFTIIIMIIIIIIIIVIIIIVIIIIISIIIFIILLVYIYISIH